LNVILTAISGDNGDLISNIFKLYVPPKSVVADVTYGKGVFWKHIPKQDYSVLESDLLTGTDFRKLSYTDGSIDCLILDPPYMHGGATVKASINDCYRNANSSHESIIRLYASGIIEAARVLKKGDTIIVKTQDEIESGKQRLSHIELIDLLERFGFSIIDLFVLVQSSIPTMREDYQKTARKNHSYAIVGRFRR
jgi:hypothetical protein